MMKIICDKLVLKETSIEDTLKTIKDEFEAYDFDVDSSKSFEIYVSAGALRIRVYQVSYKD